MALQSKTCECEPLYVVYEARNNGSAQSVVWVKCFTSCTLPNRYKQIKLFLWIWHSVDYATEDILSHVLSSFSSTV